MSAALLQMKADDEGTWPIVPLGQCVKPSQDGWFYYFRDWQGELQRVEFNRVSPRDVDALFGPHVPRLQEVWPRRDRKRGADYYKIICALIRACARKGVFKP